MLTAALAAPRVASLRLTTMGERVLEAPSMIADIPSAAVSALVRHDTSDSYLGFDTNVYPGDQTMRAWKDEGPYQWVGYYLPAPCHRDGSWAGQRETLTNMGWGLAVIYVGQQTWGKRPGEPHVVTKYVTHRVKQHVRVHGRRVTRTVRKRVAIRIVEPPRATPGSTCSTHFVSGARGVQEAADAIARTQAEGFARGTAIFLDVERMDFTPPAMRDYVKAWVTAVLQDGRYRPGIYAHTYNAEMIYRDVKSVYAAAGLNAEPPFWVAGGSKFSPDKTPSDVGHAFASVWQGVLDKMETRGGVRLPIDINVASVPSPSSHAYASAE